jgi:hypothetical protein
VRKIPEILPDPKQKLEGLHQPIEYLQRVFSEIESLTSSAGKGPAGDTAVSVSSGRRTWPRRGYCSSRWPPAIAFLRGLIEVLPRFSDKRQAVCIATEIQMGGYLRAITAMNRRYWPCQLSEPSR